MITVLAYFYHPDLGTIRGTVINGTPMISCNETVKLLGFCNTDGFKEIFRKKYNAKDAIVPVSVDTNGIAKTEKLLFIGIDAAYGILKLSPNGQGYKYSVWLGDFVFPMLRQMAGTSEVTEDAQYFYWECTDPKPEKTADEMLNNHLFDLFD